MKRKRIPYYFTFFVLLWAFGICVIATWLIYSTQIFERGTTVTIRNTSKSGYDYLLRFPPGYTDFGGKRPLLVYLHGAGEVGKDVNILRNMDVYAYAMNANLHNTNSSGATRSESSEGKANCPPRLRGFPFIVVSPMTPKHGWDAAKLVVLIEELLDDTRFRYSIDPERIYLTGFSMGGFGTFDTACRHPDIFAAVVPLAGGGNVESASNMKEVPVWAFHGDADEVVWYDLSKNMIEAIEKEGNQNAKLTTLRGAGHGMPEQVYTRPDLYKWLLEQRKEIKQQDDDATRK
ncbi:MAG: prolyl oligopeptidase family serine peptidase [Thermoguttaceae bacterium]